MQARIAKLEELSAAALIEADHTGFAIEEVERRLNDFVAATRPILVWQRDAPFLSSDEQQKSIKSCTWHDPASDYLIEHYNRFLTARDPVNTLAILLDGHIKRKRKPDSPPKEPDHSRSASGPGLDSQSVQTVKPNEQPQKTPEFSTNPRLSSNRPIKQPSPDAIAAYRAQLTTGMNQKELAEMLSKELGRLVYQGTVSRWLNHVKTWIEAGNVLPDITKPLNTRPTAMDPREIDLGPRQDGRAARQRERRNSDGQD
jgi:hypothetical protein